MSKKDADGAKASSKEGKESKKRSNLLPAIILAAGIVVGGMMMKGGGSKASASSPIGATTTTAPNGPIVKFDDITLNLADGHYLKLGLALQLTTKAKPDDYQTGGASAKAFDIAISTLGDETYNQLAAAGGRDAAKNALQGAVIKAYDGQVSAIYFTDFVMQ